MLSQQFSILCVEAHDDTRAMLKMMLERSNFRVTTVDCDEECVKLLERNHYDLLLLEHTSFGQADYGLCRIVAEIDREMPILYFTTRAYPADRAHAKQAGAQGYLVKPNDLPHLTGEIARLISKKRQPHAQLCLFESY